MSKEATTSPLNQLIGVQASTIRKQRGLTLRDIEERTGILTGQLSGLERGVRNWLPHHLEAVALALEVNPAALLGNEEFQVVPAAPAPRPDPSLELAALRALVAQYERDARRLADDLRRLVGEGGG